LRLAETPSAQQDFPFLNPPAGPDEIGRLGGYRVLRLVDRGGMGLVFHAEDIGLHRPVALKVMKPDLNQHPDAWKRFLREARIMASVKHDHLVTVYQVGQENNVVYLAMELLDGMLLDDWIRFLQRATAADILRIGREIASGLAVIHNKGLIHRDIKPNNIWLEAPNDRVKILDFGLVYDADANTKLTESGAIVGTPDFMSPEQARGEPIDGRSDLFSLGGVLYRLGTGVNPFAAGNFTGVLTALAVDDPRHAMERNPSLPEELSDLIMQLLAKDPNDRPQSAEEVIERLQAMESSLTDPSCTRSEDSPTRVFAPRKGKTKNANDTNVLSKRSVYIVLASVLVGLALGVSLMIGLRPAPSPAPSTAPASQPAPAVRTYLVDIKPFTQVMGQPPPPLPGMRPGEIRIGRRPSPKSILMYAPRPDEKSPRLTYRLDKRFGKFHMGVTQNEIGFPAATPCIFVVSCDGNERWRSTPVAMPADWQETEIDVANVELLVLEVQCNGNPRGGQMVWIEPYLE
jgi:serine/threonine protein kinase